MKRFKLLSISLLALAVSTTATATTTVDNSSSSTFALFGGKITFNGGVYDGPTNAETRAFYDSLDTTVEHVLKTKPEATQFSELKAWAKSYNDSNFYSKIDVTVVNEKQGVVDIYFP